MMSFGGGRGKENYELREYFHFPSTARRLVSVVVGFHASLPFCWCELIFGQVIRVNKWNYQAKACKITWGKRDARQNELMYLVLKTVA